MVHTQHEYYRILPRLYVERRSSEDGARSGPTVRDADPSSTAQSETAAAAAATGGKADESRGSTATGGGGDTYSMKPASAGNDTRTNLPLPASGEGVHSDVVDGNGTRAKTMNRPASYNAARTPPSSLSSQSGLAPVENFPLRDSRPASVPKDKKSSSRSGKGAKKSSGSSRKRRERREAGDEDASSEEETVERRRRRSRSGSSGKVFKRNGSKDNKSGRAG